MMITVPALALTVSPELIGISNVAFAVMLLTCWYASMSISPFVPFAVVVGNSIVEKPTSVTFKHNLRFFILVLFLSPIVIKGFNYLNQ
ncbi:hypothetical protein [Tepidibacillus marianensis]|uniref:hypothetical protein n=1 Tax=Tepidibacillus marianensis TaxID=3131995 RepID=UPI0030D1A008